MLSSYCQSCATPRPGQGDMLELADLVFRCGDLDALSYYHDLNAVLKNWNSRG